ncbi:MAG: hypothetical protein JNK76_14155 [Planctomycetales bacterium]|nr:hypothetical protein [Planctomycetales bacterium]MBN8627094.1 hypothetical protein [Planctomycetota bacterium]
MESPPAKRRFRWWFVVLGVCAGAVLFAGLWFYPVWKFHKAVKAIRLSGGYVELVPQGVPQDMWEALRRQDPLARYFLEPSWEIWDVRLVKHAAPEWLDDVGPLARTFALEIISDFVADADLERLPPLPNLIGVTVSGKLFTSRGLETIFARAPQLKYLHFHGERIRDDVIDVALRFPQLELLDLSDTSLGDGAAERLLRQKRIQTIDIAGTKITSACLERIGAAAIGPGAIDVSRTEVNDAGMAVLLAAPHIKSLGFDELRLGERTIAALRANRTLEFLNVAGHLCLKEDELAAAIGAHPALGLLVYDDNYLPVRYLQQFWAAPKLSTVHAVDCDVTAAEIQAAKELYERDTGRKITKEMTFKDAHGPIR